MNNSYIRDLFEGLKQPERSEALSSAITVEGFESEKVSLVPVGNWVLDDDSLVALLSEWRKKAMSFFFYQFEATADSMAFYIENYSIQQPDRILFLIFVEDVPVAHLGLSGVGPERAVLDNMIRGESLGPRTLMLAAEDRLISWAFLDLKISKLELKVQSRNVLAKRLHNQMGFKVVQSVNLRRVGDETGFHYEECSEKEATEPFRSEIMSLSREDWLRMRNIK